MNPVTALALNLAPAPSRLAPLILAALLFGSIFFALHRAVPSAAPRLADDLEGQCLSDGVE